MFSYRQIRRFNKTDMTLYHAVMDNPEAVRYMSIRDFAERNYVSPSTVLRFCGKIDCATWNEFKRRLGDHLADSGENIPATDDAISQLDLFFSSANTPAFEQCTDEGVALLRGMSLIVLVGVGSSEPIAQCGARYLSNLGRLSIALEDAFYPADAIRRVSGGVGVIAISESGETESLIDLVREFSASGSPVLSITNTGQCTLATLSQWNFSYGLPSIRTADGYNVTTQVPALFVVETLARKLADGQRNTMSRK